MSTFESFVITGGYHPDQSISVKATPPLHDISLPPCHGGEVVAVIGPNAAGKSTLFQRIAAIVPGTGELRLTGVATPDRAVAYMPQDQSGSAILTAFESVLLARKQVSGWRLLAGDLVVVDRALSMLDIGHLANEVLSELSGGQRQLVGLAQCLVREPQILLLDEPTSALDMHRQIEAKERVCDLARENGARIGCAARPQSGAEIRRQGSNLMRGTLHDFCTPDRVLTPDNLAITFRIEARIEPCSQGKLPTEKAPYPVASISLLTSTT